MKRILPKLALFAVAAVLASPFGVAASGSYCTCIPKPPPKGAAESKVEREKYALGQKLYNAKTPPEGAVGDATAQRTRLQALQTALPEKVGKKKDLTANAGKLTAEQLDALEYYVGQRYPKGK